MKQMITLFALMSLSVSLSAATIKLNGQKYIVVETQAHSSQSAITEDATVMVGDKVAISPDSEKLTVTGSILVKAGKSQAKALADKYNLNMVSYLEGVALMEAKPSVNILILEKVLNKELNTPVNLELHPQNQRPQ
ncbi:hypothetical protein [Vibrio coralliilyticus]|uniref:hypothetical protein n=1 Tax=Vibrio coralliilyticus TaxID=190893 RepID=UPI0017D8B7C8|nr:hypothetical protein [Vibrio coralliilyticus]NUW67106.1 hypothetical protein [Vibrio coralliilyticus]